jgi:hypothetical protein
MACIANEHIKGRSLLKDSNMIYFRDGFHSEGLCKCASNELDLFSVPLTQMSVESGKFVEYRPVSTLMNGLPIEFDIASSGDDFIDFANSYILVKVKITKANGNNLDDNDAVGPVNNFLHSLFSQVDVSLNGTLITNSSNTYPYRAYIENLLSYGPAARRSQLTACLFYKDAAGKMDKANSGLINRATFTAQSRESDLMGRIHTDIFF